MEGPEGEPTVTIDIAEFLSVKVRALRLYRSQQDAQEVATRMVEGQFTVETFHQAWPEKTAEEMDTAL